MASTDFFSPYFVAALVLKDGTALPLWTTEADPIAARDMESRIGIRALPFLTSISVTLNLADLPVINATLSFPYREGIEFLNSEASEWGVNELQVMFGYSKGSEGDEMQYSPVFTGLVMETQPSYGVDIGITLTAHGAFSLTQMERNFDFKGLTRRQILQACLDGPDPKNTRGITIDSSQLEPSIDHPETQDSIDASILLGQPMDDFEPCAKTDWDIIYLVCNQLKCWPQFVVAKPPQGASNTVFGKKTPLQLKLIPRKAGLARAPKKILSMFEIDSGVFRNTLPVMGLSVETKAIYLPGALKGMVARGIGSADKLPIHKFYDHTVNAQGLVGQGGGVPKDTRELPGVNASTSQVDGASTMPFNADHTDRDTEAVRLYEKTMAEMGVTINVETLGSPDLDAGDVISLRGAGNRLDGNYGIQEITHRFDSGGYTTSFKAFTNTSNQDPANTVGKLQMLSNTDTTWTDTTVNSQGTLVSPVAESLYG